MTISKDRDGPMPHNFCTYDHLFVKRERRECERRGIKDFGYHMTVLACKNCNQTRGDMLAMEWLERVLSSCEA